jgi:RHS repeat-associated protein
VGNLRFVTDPLGSQAGDDEHTTWYVYDAVNRRTHVIDALDADPTPGTDPYDRWGSLTFTPGHPTVTSYDAVGKVVSVTDPEGNTTRFDYDRLDRLTSETNQLDDTRSYEYDAVGNLVRRTDRNALVTEYVYDGVGRQTEEKWLGAGEEVVHTIHRQYDAAGQLTDVVETDEDGLLTGVRYQYVYDSRGNVISARMAPGELTQRVIARYGGTLNEWDDTIDWDNDQVGEPYEWCVFSWDVGDAVVADMHSGDFDAALIARREYAPLEEWLIDDNGGPGTDAHLEFTVDEAGTWYFYRTSPDVATGDYRLDVTVDPIDPFEFPTHLIQFQYAYDLAGNLTQAVDSQGGRTEYDYDPLHRLGRVEQSGSGVAPKRADFTYHDDGQFDTINRYADLAGTQLVAASSYGYDDIGRLTGLDHTYGIDESIYEWEYDVASRIVDVTLPDGSSVFDYDATDQLVDATHSYQDDEAYDYDDNGNRELVDDTIAYDTEEGNRLESDGHYRYEYDAEGNRTLRFVDEDENEELNAGDTDVTEYQWDYRNRLVKVTERATYGGVATQVVEYTYDYLDRRIGKTVDSDGDGTPEEFSYQVHRGDELALEFTDPDGLADETYAPEVSHRYLYGAAVDQILAVEDDSGDVLWGLGDHQGTIRDVVDSAGELENHVQYDAFGRITDGAVSADFLFAFTGRPYDPDTGLYDYRARWYDADVGRFVTEDPAGFDAGDVNLYRYCGNGPVINVDPSGLCFSGFSSAVSSLASAFQGAVTTLTSVVNTVANTASRWTTQTFAGLSAGGTGAFGSAGGFRSDVVFDGPMMLYSGGLGPPTQEQMRSMMLFSPQHYHAAMSGDTSGVIGLPLWAGGSVSSAGLPDSVTPRHPVMVELAGGSQINLRESPPWGLDFWKVAVSDSYTHFVAPANELCFQAVDAYSEWFARDRQSEPALVRFLNDYIDLTGGAGLGVPVGVARPPMLPAGRSVSSNVSISSAKWNRIFGTGTKIKRGSQAAGVSVPRTAVRTNAQLVDDIGTRAGRWVQRSRQQRNLANAAPQSVAIRQHDYARRVLDRYQKIYGQRGLSTEVRYYGGRPWRSGDPLRGSVRLDVVEGPLGSPTAVYDYKFGAAGLRPGRIRQIRTGARLSPSVPVVEVPP